MLLCKFFLICLIARGVQTLSSIKNDVRSMRDLKGTEEPEQNMTTIGIIKYFGYPAEVHTVQTSDGYILELHRIPHGPKTSEGPRTPVIAQHCLLCSSADYIMNYPSQSLGYALADAGFDVWLTNVRGNTYGRKHIKYDPDHDSDFWNFSWEEMGTGDLPAIIDYVLNTTSYNQLYYVGHSMGTTMALVMLSMKPEYNSKIKTFLAMGPVATLNDIASPIKYLAPFSEALPFISELLGTGEFLPSDKFIQLVAQNCDASLKILCKNAIFLMCGYNTEELNTTRLDVYLSHTPAGTSSRTVTHYAQVVESRTFGRYNWGFWENNIRYGQFYPPEYNLSKVTVPTVLFWGYNDWLADPTDVKHLAKSLPNVIGSIEIGSNKWAHLDFLWGINTGTLLNPQVIAHMPKF